MQKSITFAVIPALLLAVMGVSISQAMATQDQEEHAQQREARLFFDLQKAMRAADITPTRVQETRLEEKYREKETASKDYQEALKKYHEQSSGRSEVERLQEEQKLIDLQRVQQEKEGAYILAEQSLRQEMLNAFQRDAERYIQFYFEQGTVDIVETHGSGDKEDTVIVLNEAYDVGNEIGRAIKQGASAETLPAVPLTAPIVHYITLETVLLNPEIFARYQSRSNEALQPLEDELDENETAMLEYARNYQVRQLTDPVLAAAIYTEQARLYKVKRELLLLKQEQENRKIYETFSNDLKKFIADNLVRSPDIAGGADVVRIIDGQFADQNPQMIFAPGTALDISEAVAQALAAQLGD